MGIRRMDHDRAWTREGGDVIYAHAHPELTSGDLATRPPQLSSRATISALRSCALAAGIVAAIGLAQHGTTYRASAAADEMVQTCGQWEAVAGHALRRVAREVPADSGLISDAVLRLQQARRACHESLRHACAQYQAAVLTLLPTTESALRCSPLDIMNAK